MMMIECDNVIEEEKKEVNDGNENDKEEKEKKIYTDLFSLTLNPNKQTNKTSKQTK